MKRARLHFFLRGLFGGALALGCASEQMGNDSQSSTTFTTSTTSGEQSGSVTSAPSSASDETIGDSAPTMASATTTASVTTTGGSSTGEACSFLTCNDMLHEGLECDNYAQDCPEGQKCAAYAADRGNSWNALKCVEVTGTDEPGNDCTLEGNLTGIDSCIKGAMCWAPNEEGVGTCVAQCTGSVEAPVCPNNTPCTISAEAALNLCLSVCDPLLQNCKGTDLCIPKGDSFICILDDSGEEGQANDPCELANACDPGLVCLDPATVGAGCDAASIGCCAPFCEFPNGACPNPDQSCVQWFDPMMLPESDPQLAIGVCAVPA